MKCLIILTSILLLCCSDGLNLKGRKLGKLFATVDTSSLYDSTLIEQYPFLKGANNFLKINYVNKWIDKKVVLKAVYDDGFHENEKIKAQLERLQEDFLIQAYMNKKIAEARVSKDDLVKYYNEHKTDFLASDNEYKYQLIYFNRKDESKRVHTYLRDKKKFNFNSLNQDLKKTILQKEIVGSFVAEKDIKSEEVKKKLKALKIGDFSQPVKYDDNYIIVKLLDKRSKGEPYPFIEVEGKIMLKQLSKKEGIIKRAIIDSVKLYSDINVYINGDENE